MGLGLGEGMVLVSNGQVSVAVLDDAVSVSVLDSEAETPSLRVARFFQVGKNEHYVVYFVGIFTYYAPLCNTNSYYKPTLLVFFFFFGGGGGGSRYL